MRELQKHLGAAVRSLVLAASFALTLTTVHEVIGADTPGLRPPSVPLVACDPYFSVWSPADKLTDADTTHWTGKPHRLTSLVRIDGRAFRLMGTEPDALPPMQQTGLEVLPTRTIYTFEGEGVRLSLTFMTPALPGDIDLLSRPVTYLTWEASSIDKSKHEIEVWFDASAELAVNVPGQQVEYASPRVRRLNVLQVGTVEQPVLMKRGDDIRIDWGYLYLAAPTSGGSLAMAGNTQTDREWFINQGAKRDNGS